MKRTNRKNKGVSTIIAAALLVAITVIIAVALGSTVLQAPPAEKPLQLQLDGWASVGENEVRLTHLGGDPINMDLVTVQTYIPAGTYQGTTYIVDPSDYAGGSLLAGDTLTIDFDGAFAIGAWGPQAPSVGEQFTVEFYYNGQPITAVSIITLP
jgi:flagellin-like protein